MTKLSKLGVVIGLLVAACGGGTSDEELAEQIVDELLGDLAEAVDEDLDVDTEAEVEADLPDPVTRTIGKTGWWGGFAITVDEVTAEATANGAVRVSLDLSFENLDGDPADAPIALIEGGGVVFDSFDQPPSMAGAGTASAVFEYRVDSEQVGAEVDDLEGTLEVLTLVYGGADDNQALIPLGAGEVQSFEPLEFEVGGVTSHGDVVASFTTASLQPSYRSGDRGRYELTFASPTVVYDCGSDCHPVGFSVNRQSFALTSPEGDTVTIADGSEFCCIGTSNIGEETSDGDMTFIVAEPLDGGYSLAMTLEDLGVGGELTDVDPVSLVVEIVVGQ